MSFDSLTIAAVADQLNQEVCPARVQRVLTVGPAAIGLELYSPATRQRRQLLLSVDATQGRVLLTNTPLTRDPALRDSPLLLLLRKYVRGGRLLSVEQPGLERVLVISIAKTFPLGKLDSNDYNSSVNPDDEEDEVDEGETHTVRLVVEVMSRHSNLVLVDEGGVILECLKRIPAAINRFRTVLPHHPYVAPPMQEKADFFALAESQFAEVVAAAASSPDTMPASGKGEGSGKSKSLKLADALVTSLRGISPQSGREIVFRASGNAATPLVGFEGWPSLYAATSDLLGLSETGRWAHCVVSVPGEEGQERVTAYAPYRLSHLAASGRLGSVPTISEAIEAYYKTQAQTVAHEQLKEQLRGQLERKRDRLRGLRYSLQTQLTKVDNIELTRYRGDAIFAYGHALLPGATSLRAPAQDGEGEIEIKLDPRRTAAENAQGYFKDYRKLVHARAALPERIAAAEVELAYFDEVAAMLDVAQGYDEITLISREVADIGKPPKEEKAGKDGKKGGKFQPKKAGKGGKDETPPGVGKLLRLLSPDGVEVYVGKSVRQNDYLTFKLASPEDIWLHARGVRGAHVIIKMRGLPAVPPRTLQFAAGLAAGRSEARSESYAEVQYSPVRQLRKPKGGALGAVLVNAEQTIRVAPLEVPKERP